MICERCGTENPERAKFCLGCAAPLLPHELAAAAARRAGNAQLEATVLLSSVAARTYGAWRLRPGQSFVLQKRAMLEAIRENVEAAAAAV